MKTALLIALMDNGSVPVGPVSARWDPTWFAVDTTDGDSYALDVTFDASVAGERAVLILRNRKAAPSASISTVSFGGMSCKKIDALQNAGSDVEIWVSGKLAVGTTSAPVAVTLTDSVLRCALGVGLVTNLRGHVGVSTLKDTMLDATEKILDGSIDAPAEGMLVGGVYTGSSDSWTWAGLTERGDELVEANGFSWASDEFAEAEAGRAISATKVNTGVQGPTLLVVGLR